VDNAKNPTEIRLIKPGAQSTSQVLSDVLGTNESTDGDGIEPLFSLEYQLRDFLASNLNALSISGKRLHLFVDPIGRDGVEFPFAVRPIDILAVDDKDSFFVFELKRANSPDRAMGQLARYMG
jgi:hypothetical protein